MMYNTYKWLHVLSASMVLGTNLYLGLWLEKLHGATTHKKKLDAFILAGRLSPMLTLPFGLTQAITGFAMISAHNIPPTLPWLWLPMLCFLFAALAWCITLYLHWQCVDALEKEKDNFAQYFHWAKRTGYLAGFFILVAVFAMSNLKLHWAA